MTVKTISMIHLRLEKCESKRAFPSRPQIGFTLLELLISIGVVLVISIISVSAVFKMVDSARSAACLSNLRQVYFSLSAYTLDHDGWTPPARYTSPSWLNWVDILIQGEYASTPIKGTRSIFVCPAFEPKTFLSTPYTYGMRLGPENSNVAFRLNIGEIVDENGLNYGSSTRFPLVFDSVMLNSGRWRQCMLGFPDRVCVVHPGQKANILFASGHVESLGPEQLEDLPYFLFYSLPDGTRYKLQ